MIPIKDRCTIEKFSSPSSGENIYRKLVSLCLKEGLIGKNKTKKSSVVYFTYW
jgi:hypothetical protein